ncbi:MAG: YceI family protein [bacterium]
MMTVLYSFIRKSIFRKAFWVLLALSVLAGDGFAREGGRAAKGLTALTSRDARSVYSIDPAQSELVIHTGTSGLFAGMGHKLSILAKEIGGKVLLSREDLSKSSLEINVKSASLAVTDKVSEKDKAEIESNMREKVLQTREFPEVSFKSTGIEVEKTGEHDYKLRIAGDFTLLGVTRSLVLPALLHLEEKRLEASGEFEIKQKDFGMKPSSGAGGMVKVKNELKVTYRIVAHP